MNRRGMRKTVAYKRRLGKRPRENRMRLRVVSLIGIGEGEFIVFSGKIFPAGVYYQRLRYEKILFIPDGVLSLRRALFRRAHAQRPEPLRRTGRIRFISSDDDGVHRTR